MLLLNAACLLCMRCTDYDDDLCRAGSLGCTALVLTHLMTCYWALWGPGLLHHLQFHLQGLYGRPQEALRAARCTCSHGHPSRAAASNYKAGQHTCSTEDAGPCKPAFWNPHTHIWGCCRWQECWHPAVFPAHKAAGLSCRVRRQGRCLLQATGGCSTPCPTRDLCKKGVSSVLFQY